MRKVDSDYSWALRLTSPADRPNLIKSQTAWLAERDRACSSPTEDCLIDQYQRRRATLRDGAPTPRGTRDEVLAALNIRQEDRGCIEFIHEDKPLFNCTPTARAMAWFKDATAAAVVIQAPTGGYAWMCSNFPTYLVSREVGGPLRVRKLEPGRQSASDGCPIATAGSAFDGIVVEFRALPTQPGFRYVWRPTEGLSLERSWIFEPLLGTTMKHLSVIFWNEQFYRALRTSLGGRFDQVERSIGHLPTFARSADGRFVVVADCKAGTKPQFCAVPDSVRVVFDLATGAAYTAIVTIPGDMRCWKPDDIADLKPTYLPKLSAWPAEAKKVLQDCELRWNEQASLNADAFIGARRCQYR